jgi:hypothetical protein
LLKLPQLLAGLVQQPARLVGMVSGRMVAVWVPGALLGLRSLLMPPDGTQMGLDFAFERLPNPRDLLGGQLCSLLVSHGCPPVGESARLSLRRQASPAQGAIGSATSRS